MQKILIIIFACILLVLLYEVVRVGYLFHNSKELIKQAIRFSRTIPNAPMNILVAGDSTAVGTGSESSLLSTAGRMGTQYPNANIVNLTENGLKIEGLLEKVRLLDQNKKFDIILIQIGANDIIRLTSYKKIEKGIDELLRQMTKLSDNVIVLHSGDIGESKFFPWFLKPMYSKRSYTVRDIYIKKTAEYRAKYVDLINSEAAAKLRENPDIYYASDYLHLTGAGYGLWFEEIKIFLD